jgi:multiple sugar transport system permease protein
MRANAVGSGWYSIRQTLSIVLLYLVLVGVGILMIAPFAIMVSAALRPNYQFLTFPMALIPERVGMDNFVRLFAEFPVGLWLRNSAIVVVSIVLLQLITGSLAGYAFARGEFWGRDTVFWIYLGTLMVPDTVMLIPLYIILTRLKLVNTLWALIVPFSATAFSTFLMRQAFQTIPRDYDDAALIDGANRFQILARVLLPQVKPALVTLAVLSFLRNWNAFLYPLVFIKKRSLNVITVGLVLMREMGGVFGVPAGVEMAGATLSFLPTLVLFLLLQRHVTSGTLLSGLKG